MSHPEFKLQENTLVFYNESNLETGRWTAANNVDSSAMPWPPGTFAFLATKTHSDDAPNSAYESYGNILFTIPGRDGMAVHSGRKTIADGLGRTGRFHFTMGCIRTTDAAMYKILNVHHNDRIKKIIVL